MKTEVHDFLHSRLDGLKRQLRFIQEKRQHAETDPSLDAERRAIEITYYEAMIRGLLEGVERLEAALIGWRPLRQRPLGWNSA